MRYPQVVQRQAEIEPAEGTSRRDLSDRQRFTECCELRLGSIEHPVDDFCLSRDPALGTLTFGAAALEQDRDTGVEQTHR